MSSTDRRDDICRIDMVTIIDCSSFIPSPVGGEHGRAASGELFEKTAKAIGHSRSANAQRRLNRDHTT